MITIQKTYELRCVVLNPTLLRSRYEYNLGTMRKYSTSTDDTDAVVGILHVGDTADDNQMLLVRDENTSCSSLALTCLWNAGCHSQ